MADRYEGLDTNLASPASGGFAVTPSDDEPLPEVTRALYVGVGGTLSVELHWGGTVSFHNLPDGALLPIRAAKVLADSTADAIIGLY